METKRPADNSSKTRNKFVRHGITLNVSYKDALIRFGITILLPIVLLLIDKHIVIYAAPVMAYLFTTGIIHFCVVKYVWHRYIKHDPAPALVPYGEDPNYPEESI
jgi:hypothetical protein